MEILLECRVETIFRTTGRDGFRGAIVGLDIPQLQFWSAIEKGCVVQVETVEDGFATIVPKYMHVDPAEAGMGFVLGESDVNRIWEGSRVRVVVE